MPRNAIVEPNQNPNNDPNQNQSPDNGAPAGQPQMPANEPTPAYSQPAVETEPSTAQNDNAFAAPAAPSAPAPVASGENPGQTLGIISIVLDVVGFAVIGIVLGVISRNKSKAAGQSTTLGTIGMVLGIIFTVIGLLYIIAVAVIAYSGIQGAASESMESSTSDSSIQYDMGQE